MSDFLNWKLTNKMHNLGYNERTLMYIDDEEGIINDDTEELIGGKNEFWKPAILTSAAFRWFRENHYLCKQDYIFDMGIQNYAFIIYSKNDGNLYDCCYSENEEMIGSGFKTYEGAELACLEKLIEIVESKSE